MQMRINYRKSFITLAVAVLAFLMIAPAQASSQSSTGVSASVETMGTIHVINVVVNDNLGTKIPADFTMYVKHFGTNVAGSPFLGTNATGMTFVLAPGTYVVSQDLVAGYVGSWSGAGVDNGFIDLQAGQEITFVRTNNDLGVKAAVVTPPATEDGGTLPSTSSPWFNALVVALLISAIGVVGLRKSVLLSK